MKPFNLKDWPKALSENAFPLKDSYENCKIISERLISKRLDFKDYKVCQLLLDERDFSLFFDNFSSLNLEDFFNKDIEFDLYFLFDVLDHIPNKNQVEGLVDFLKKKNKKIFLYSHPYRSRLGSHRLEENLAYIHLYDNKDKEHFLDIEDPYSFYMNLFKNYSIDYEFIQKEWKEPEFKIPTSDYEYFEVLFSPKIHNQNIDSVKRISSFI